MIHIIYSIDRYRHLRQFVFDAPTAEVAIAHFNHDFTSKEAFKDLLVRSEGSNIPDLDFRIVRRVIDAVGKPAIHLRSTKQLDDYVLNNFDEFWSQIEADENNCHLYMQLVLRSAVKILHAHNGKPVALLSQDDEITGLTDLAEISPGDEEYFGNTFKAYYKDDLPNDKNVFAFIQKRCLIDSGSHEPAVSSELR